MTTNTCALSLVSFSNPVSSKRGNLFFETFSNVCPDANVILFATPNFLDARDMFVYGCAPIFDFIETDSDWDCSDNASEAAFWDAYEQEEKRKQERIEQRVCDILHDIYMTRKLS